MRKLSKFLTNIKLNIFSSISFKEEYQHFAEKWLFKPWVKQPKWR